MNITVLYARVTGYVAACLEALAAENNSVQLQVFRWPASANAPFDFETFDWIDELYVKNELGASEIERKVRSFGPDAVLMSGWVDQEYLHVARRFEPGDVPIVAICDNQWEGTLSQRFGRLIAPWYLKSAIDVLWVPGERQRQMAYKLGYSADRCWIGAYACDWARFANVFEPRSGSPRTFLYVGRYVEDKGIDTLVEAYRKYRVRTQNPWSLTTAGAGPMAALLDREKGINNRGFLQPHRLPELMQEAGAFVLPSRQEPWGVVIQEAAAAGLPLLCSTASGAGVHLLQDGYNGFQIEKGSVSHLAKNMWRMGRLTKEERNEMGRRGHHLSKQFTPRRWAKTFESGIRKLKNRYK